jgi:putative membrane protein
MISRGIDLRSFISYKCVNSLFTGLSVGSVFTLYAPLEPSVFSLGGVLLAVAMLAVAKFYVRIMNRRWFFRISLGVEGVMLALVAYYLLFPYDYATALLMYAGYQVTFAFGSYLVRAETMLLANRPLLTLLDVAKQKGYLAGMALAYLFYTYLEQVHHVTASAEQVYDLHLLLLAVELVTMLLLLRAFGVVLRRRNF